MRERREELGLTQPQVADRFPGLSVTKDYISRWERGAVEPGEDYLGLAAEALETTVADLMAGPISERKPKGPTPDLSLVPEPEPDDRISQLEAQIADLAKALEEFRGQAAASATEVLRRLDDISPPSSETQHRQPA